MGEEVKGREKEEGAKRRQIVRDRKLEIGKGRE